MFDRICGGRLCIPLEHLFSIYINLVPGREKFFSEIIRGKRAVMPDTALRLARVTGMSADFWLGLQQDWDLWYALHSEGVAVIEELEPLPHVS